MLLAHLIPYAPRVFFTLAILIGLAAGRCNAAWRDVTSNGEPIEVFFGCIILALGIIGSGLFACCVFLAARQPAASSLLGMQRSLWLLGVPLAWLFGVAVGIMWKHL